MIRMLLLLCAGLFLTLQIGGQDKGQMRFGLTEAARTPARVVVPVADETMAMDAPSGAAFAAPVASAPQTVPAPEEAMVLASFGAAQPIMRQAAPVTGAETAPDGAVWYVTGRSVNVRIGPSTRDDVLGRLTRGEAVTVVAVEDNGWARVRLEGDGVDGFMSMSFLSDSAP
ncbi:SH3 domain-containing protein [Pseudotabrizicola sediminis]|uniref:SH3 domain-containing protein n=1 Tax=Pseudotabrizicola sediminis TaxID=2486418 RepID=A0ABY2KTY5_9RHOB|nr:SH3 domain-containing protein [Pseudotabrizicola sediminis]TGD44844.1 SH3 domain-containing protein [Pseudotabrizicola sediminis]